MPSLRKQLKAVQGEHDELARQVEAAKREQQPLGLGVGDGHGYQSSSRPGVSSAGPCGPEWTGQRHAE